MVVAIPAAMMPVIAIGASSQTRAASILLGSFPNFSGQALGWAMRAF